MRSVGRVAVSVSRQFKFHKNEVFSNFDRPWKKKVVKAEKRVNHSQKIR